MAALRSAFIPSGIATSHYIARLTGGTERSSAQSESIILARLAPVGFISPRWNFDTPGRVTSRLEGLFSSAIHAYLSST
ncbi:MAG: hypothetical protein DMG21_02765 [Acidobacteria bacterium]|nr:MAG: hypothetical protein DMG21_02765 [Acidobacteriota bacterium]